MTKNIVKAVSYLSVMVCIVIIIGTLIPSKARAQESQRLVKQGNANADAAEAKTDSWPKFEDARFTIRYPPGWEIRERGETDADGQHFSFKDGTKTIGGMGVSFLKRSSVFGSEVKNADVAAYAAMLTRVVQVDATFVKEFTRGAMTGRRFNASQSINGKPATWRLDVVEVDATYIGLVFGFYRPENAPQRKLVETALDTFELQARR